MRKIASGRKPKAYLVYRHAGCTGFHDGTRADFIRIFPHRQQGSAILDTSDIIQHFELNAARALDTTPPAAARQLLTS